MTADLETKLMNHLTHLCVEIGPRPIGSKENQAAAAYIQGFLKARGLVVERQEFPCPIWKEIDTQLEVDGQKLVAAANYFSPPCDVTAPALVMGTIAELEAAELEGRVGVMHGELMKGTGFSAKSAAHFPEHVRKAVDLLEEKKPAALVTINSKTSCLERLIRDWEFSIASVTVPAEAGLTLLKSSDQTLRLRIDSRQSPSHFCNVVARKEGSKPDQVVLLAHFDTMANTPGASDNGTGVAVLLALAEVFAQRDLAIGLEWIAVNGEENGGLGDAQYMRHMENKLEHALAVINVDGAGQCLGANSITAMGASQSFQEQVRQVHTRYPGVAWSGPWYESDHSAFLWRGVPCVPISSIGGVNITHLPTDTIEWISPAKLREVVSLIVDVVESLQDKSPGWCRPEQGDPDPQAV
jgi:aminopeptidase YwaD